MKTRYVFAFLPLFLSACSTPSEMKELKVSDKTVYLDALTLIDKGEYTKAVSAFDSLERNYPYSSWAKKGQLMASYLLYRKGKYADALLVLDRFIALHPGDKDAPYTYFLKGMCFYEQVVDVERDQEFSKEAFKTFNELLLRFPTSPYAKKAQELLSISLDQLAGKEMEIGRFYLKDGNISAAISRFQTVLQRYGKTPYVEEALYRLVESYHILGLKSQEKALLITLQKSYKDSKWTAKATALLGK
ncbi:MAG: outer membrane protein assembly factor BamD [Alphaproteobacteria bacterium]|nr:outer membrane protein assembly factor BamD [Alphaproteobacteria bacterium]